MSHNSSYSQKKSFSLLKKKEIPEADYFTLVPSKSNQNIIHNEDYEPTENVNINEKSQNESQSNEEENSNISANEHSPSFQIHSLSPNTHNQNNMMLYLSSNNDLNQIETRQSKPTEEKDEEEIIENKYKQEIFERCKANQNDQKEKFIEEKLKQKISQKVKKNLYQEEYKVVYDKIKREVQQKIANDFLTKKKRELDIQKKKIEYNTQSKLIDFKNKLYIEYKEQSNVQKLSIIKEKEKEIEEKCKNDLMALKDKIKRELINQYQNKENELRMQLNEAKENLIVQKEKEKKRIEQLNKIKNGYVLEEEFQKEKNKEIENLIDNYKNYEMNMSKNNLSSSSGFGRKTSYQNFKQKKSPKIATNLKKMKSVQKFNNNNKGNPFDMISEERSSINLREVNNRIKFNSPRIKI